MFEQLNEASLKPALWSNYTADVLWTDAHIAKHMLSYHLNQDIDAASRSFAFIDKSVNWLCSRFNLNAHSKIIDFGCGPGFYTQRLKAKGIGTVVGLDFSENSLRYARKQAEQAKLGIEYHLGNYLNYSDTRQFDLISLVMCDLCALSPAQRAQLFAKFKTLLAAKGVIALDVYTAARFEKQTECLNLDKNAMNGFWSAQDYWCVQASFNYTEALVTLDKYSIIEATQTRVVYNWLQHFTPDMLNAELAPHGLKVEHLFADLCGNALSDGDEMALIIGHA